MVALSFKFCVGFLFLLSSGPFTSGFLFEKAGQFLGKPCLVLGYVPAKQAIRLCRAQVDKAVQATIREATRRCEEAVASVVEEARRKCEGGVKEAVDHVLGLAKTEAETQCRKVTERTVKDVIRKGRAQAEDECANATREAVVEEVEKACTEEDYCTKKTAEALGFGEDYDKEELESYVDFFTQNLDEEYDYDYEYDERIRRRSDVKTG